MNANIRKAQIFQKINYYLKGHSYIIERLCDFLLSYFLIFLQLRLMLLRTTFVLVLIYQMLFSPNFYEKPIPHD